MHNQTLTIKRQPSLNEINDMMKKEKRRARKLN